MPAGPAAPAPLQDTPEGGTIDVSVVVPAYFGAKTIADCLDSVQRATAGRRREIIVVESSGDATAAIIRERFPDVVLIVSETRLTAGAARNRGASVARGKLIFFTDQDCLVPPDWVDRLAPHLADPTVGGAGGAVGIRDLSNLSGCAVYFLEFLTHFPVKGAARRDANFLVGCNSAYRADALRLTRFPDRTLGEDVLFSDRLRLCGFSIIYDPQVEVRHENRQGWGEFFAYNRKMGRSAASYHQVLRRWWVDPFLRVPFLAFLAPLVILPTIAFDLARTRWSYFGRFLFLWPMCLVGNLMWANAFRRHVLETRAHARNAPT
jgi:GT2 family glycosyltransferase